MVVTRRPHSTIPSQSVGIFQADFEDKGTYVVLEDISRYERPVDARVFVGFEVDKCVFGDALMYSYVFRYLSALVRKSLSDRLLGVEDAAYSSQS